MFCKKGVLKNSAKFTRNTCAKVFFIETNACNIIKKEALAQVFLRTPFFYRSPPGAASGDKKSHKLFFQMGKYENILKI